MIDIINPGVLLGEESDIEDFFIRDIDMRALVTAQDLFNLLDVGAGINRVDVFLDGAPVGDEGKGGALEGEHGPQEGLAAAYSGEHLPGIIFSEDPGFRFGIGFEPLGSFDVPDFHAGVPEPFRKFVEKEHIVNQRKTYEAGD